MTRSYSIVAVALVALTAVLVGFQGVSTLLTVTQLGASTANPSAKQPRLPALPPQTTTALAKPSEPAPMPAPRASEPAPDEPASATTAASDATPMPVVPGNSTGIAAALKAKAQAEMDAMGPQLSDDEAPPPESRRRYRAPRPELHKVY